MARARNIKPGFYRDAALVELPVETRLLFPGLWMLADREGRLEDNPKQIKMEIYPCDNFDINSLLEQLSDADLITRYKVDGKSYIQINNFIKHQNPHKQEPPSAIPPAPVKTGELQIKPESIGSHPADSLIPDSLIPDSTPLSGKPDIVLANGKQKFKDDAEAILTFLNEKSGKHFRPVKANLDIIAERLKSGASADDCRSMIAMMIRKWKGTDQFQYIRPETLFRASKFEGYIGELHHD